MPIYEFACRKCNTDFEKLVPASQRDSVSCPRCGNEKTLRKVSLAAPAQIVARTFRCSGESCDAPQCCGGACRMAD